ncbi:hypothetical protein [Sphingomonas sp. 4RDLI-65]|uniref:hypothetical protein n=1 Tax=Sphingomonas sp. 4RDLI-65 TaxID=3111641 RepID=UPI003C2CF054
MTTYPLSEPATIYAAEPSDGATSEAVGQGTLEECVDIVAAFSADRQKSVFIQMDDIDLKFGPREISDLLRFLRAETTGLSNTEIAEVKSANL